MAIVLPKFPRRRPPAGLATETQPAVNVSLDRDDGRYPAGGWLRAQWRVRRVSRERVQGAELSVLWYTEGKGDEDLHVHHFQRWSADQIRSLDLQQGQPLACRLPATPLSYRGRLITIRWSVRLRLFLEGGKDTVTEQPFHLVTPAMMPAVGREEWAVGTAAVSLAEDVSGARRAGQVRPGQAIPVASPPVASAVVAGRAPSSVR